MFRTRAMDTLPQTITHERIYILPSRRGWVFLLSLMVMLIASINYNLSLGYALCFMLTGLFTAALISTYRNLTGIRVNTVHGQESVAGGTLSFAITLGNQNRYERIGIDIGNSDVLVRSDLRALAETTAVMPVPAIKRGRQACGRLTLSSDYPLGLWFTWSYIHGDYTGLVLPALEADPPPLPFGTDTLPQSDAKKTNQGEFVSIRPYQPGDSPGSIAWKSAARGYGLHTREFAAEQRSADLTLDWEATRGLDLAEHRISRLAAWVNMATVQDLPFALVLPGDMLAMGHGIKHCEAAMRMLALYEI